MGAIEKVRYRMKAEPKRCTEAGHHRRSSWMLVGRKGCPVVGVSVCSICGLPATMRDHLAWRKAHDYSKNRATAIFP